MADAAAPGGPTRAHAAAKVPDVVLGPDALEAAARVEARIAEVTVYSDRARVRRRGRVALPAGTPAVVRLPDLPGAVFLDTVRLAAGGARVLRVEAVPVERQRLAIDQAKKLLDELDAVNDRIAAVDARGAEADWMAGLLARLAPAAPVSEEKREGRKGLAVDVPSWMKALDFVGERATAVRTGLARLVDERRDLAERRDRLRADVSALNQGGFSTRVVQVSAVIESASAATADLELEYFVPGARWKPIYDLHFAPARGQVRLETAAMVDQTTGEDWVDAALTLSTAAPGRGIDLPELLTWTLGERSDFIPRPRPAEPARAEAPLPSAPPAPPPSSSAAHAIEDEMLRARLASTVTSATEEVEGKKLEEKNASELSRLQSEAESNNKMWKKPARQAFRGSAPMPTASAAPSAAPAAPAPPLEMDYGDIPEAEAPPPARMLLADRSKDSSASYTAVPLALVDATAARPAPTFLDPYLPAVSAGGLDYVYQAPTAATIPSTGKQVRVPLAAQSFKTTTFYQATPSLAATAFLRARVRNDGKRPLLRGPATIFADGELVGVGEIKTTGPGGEIELPLGADQDIRLVRQVVPATRTTGLIMKSEETTYDVTIQIGNYKKQPATVEVVDQVPLSRQDKVQVKLLGTDPGPLAAPDADGVLRWRVDLAAGATRSVRLRYQVVRPKGWMLYQQ
jgi:hypothetical protein